VTRFTVAETENVITALPPLETQTARQQALGSAILPSKIG
jgi:hypothetical protein